MHWRNSNFQIEHFLEAHTPDEQYRILCEQREDRMKALALAKATKMKVDAEINRCNYIKEHPESAYEKDMAEAQLAFILAERIGEDACIKAAEQELAFIENLIKEVTPYRKFAHLPDEEAFQLCQQDEWELKLIRRAQAMLATQGFIPWDHLQTMAAHPAYKTKILPAIGMARKAIACSRDLPELTYAKGTLSCL